MAYYQFVLISKCKIIVFSFFCILRGNLLKRFDANKQISLSLSIEHNENVIGRICQNTKAIIKEYNIKREYCRKNARKLMKLKVNYCLMK